MTTIPEEWKTPPMTFWTSIKDPIRLYHLLERTMHDLKEATLKEVVTPIVTYGDFNDLRHLKLRSITYSPQGIMVYWNGRGKSATTVYDVKLVTEYYNSIADDIYKDSGFRIAFEEGVTDALRP